MNFLSYKYSFSKITWLIFLRMAYLPTREKATDITFLKTG